MEVVDRERVLDDVVAELVGLAVDLAALGAAAGHPHGETARVVVAAVVLLGESALAVDRAAEFAAPDDEGVVEHPALLEILDKGMARLVDVLALAGHAAVDVGVVVPVVVVDLDEADAAFDEATGHQHAVREAAALAGFFAVELEDVLRFLGEVGEFRHRGLHAEGHLILLDAGMGLRIAHGLIIEAVELVDAVDGLLAQVVGHAGRVVDEEDRVALAAERDAGVFARQVAAGPETARDGLFLVAVGRGRDEHHEVREVVVLGAEAVGGPGAEAGTTRDLVAGLHGADRRLVVDRLGVEGAHPADLVGVLAEVRQQVGVQPHAALAMLGEVILRRRDGEAGLAAGHRRQALAVADARGQVLVVHLLHLRLVVEEVHLGGAADHVEVDDALGLGQMLRADRARRGVGHRAAEQARERGGAEGVGARAEEAASGLEGVPLVEDGHGDYLLRTSSRLRSWLQTIVQAASSGRGSFSSDFASPTPRRAAASSGLAT